MYRYEYGKNDVETNPKKRNSQFKKKAIIAVIIYNMRAKYNYTWFHPQLCESTGSVQVGNL